MCVRILLALFTVLLPSSFLFAAGFAKESLFLSKSPVLEGEVVYIHAVVANDSNSNFKGEVIFEDGEQKIGAVAVTIAPGGAQAVSLSWEPTVGSHSLVAELTAPNNSVVEKLSATFVVQAKSKSEDEVASSTIVQSSEDVKKALAGVSPGLADAATPLLTTLDSLRQKGTEALDMGIKWAKRTGDQPPGTNTGLIDTTLGVVKTVLTYLMELLKFMLGNAGIFYPALAITFLYILWRTFKRFRRPKYE